jgi:hypothetical protein
MIKRKYSTTLACRELLKIKTFSLARGFEKIKTYGTYCFNTLFIIMTKPSEKTKGSL